MESRQIAHALPEQRGTYLSKRVIVQAGENRLPQTMRKLLVVVVQLWGMGNGSSLLWPISICILFAEELMGAAWICIETAAMWRAASKHLVPITPPTCPVTFQRTIPALFSLVEPPPLARMWERLTNLELKKDGSWVVSMRLGHLRLTWVLHPIAEPRRLCGPVDYTGSLRAAEEEYVCKIRALADAQGQPERYELSRRACPLFCFTFSLH
jgi:hypothetical protein